MNINFGKQPDKKIFEMCERNYFCIEGSTFYMKKSQSYTRFGLKNFTLYNKRVNFVLQS